MRINIIRCHIETICPMAIPASSGDGAWCRGPVCAAFIIVSKHKYYMSMTQTEFVTLPEEEQKELYGICGMVPFYIKTHEYIDIRNSKE